MLTSLNILNIIITWIHYASIFMEITYAALREGFPCRCVYESELAFCARIIEVLLYTESTRCIYIPYRRRANRRQFRMYTT
jgi:hypothetical protein